MEERAIISRAQARLEGLKHYYTGLPCKRGHVTQREVNSRKCLDCILLRSKTRKRSVKLKDKVCIGCGSAFRTDRRATVYCSKTCASNTRPDVRSKRSISAMNEEARIKTRIKLCTICGVSFEGAFVNQTCCSIKCKNQRIIRRRYPPVETHGNCKYCLENFTTVRRYTRKATTFCSKRCSDRYSRDIRKRRQKAAYHEPYSKIYVFLRDGWKCGICGEHVERSREFPDLRSPSIDHIQPLSKGGHDVLSNVQCAHLICNSYKSNKWSPENQTTYPVGDRISRNEKLTIAVLPLNTRPQDGF